MTTGYENLRLGLYGEMDKIGHKIKWGNTPEKPSHFSHVQLFIYISIWLVMTQVVKKVQNPIK